MAVSASETGPWEQKPTPRDVSASLWPELSDLFERAAVEERHRWGLLGADHRLRGHRPGGAPAARIGGGELLDQHRVRRGRGPAVAGRTQGPQRVCLTDVDVEQVLAVGPPAADQLTRGAERAQRDRLELVLELLPGGHARGHRAIGVLLSVVAVPAE